MNSLSNGKLTLHQLNEILCTHEIFGGVAIDAEHPHFARVRITRVAVVAYKGFFSKSFIVDVKNLQTGSTTRYVEIGSQDGVRVWREGSRDPMTDALVISERGSWYQLRGIDFDHLQL